MSVIPVAAETYAMSWLCSQLLLTSTDIKKLMCHVIFQELTDSSVYSQRLTVLRVGY